MLFRQLFNISKQLPTLGRFSVVTRTFATDSSVVTQDFTKHVEASKKVLKNIETLTAKENEGRLFAIVHLLGKQFKVTDGDIILLEGYWAPNIGDKIRIDKVLLAGGKDFTLIGTPLVKPGLVDVQATVIEKTLTHTKTNFKKKKTRQYMRINFVRNQNTMVRINSITLKGQMADLEKESRIERVF
ncbi:large ribosomal subunit protein bL21m [Culicoides brevitarsis]|uniref:large ribosomal subunit protein bL21m n=1 Tax=Culicoides brevitarsis TaxID=469753 RepID=UPI00307C2B0C